MKLYLIKRANYKLQPYNLIGEVYNANNELIGAIFSLEKKMLRSIVAMFLI